MHAGGKLLQKIVLLTQTLRIMISNAAIGAVDIHRSYM
jgi:hypothetical protein